MQLKVLKCKINVEIARPSTEFRFSALHLYVHFVLSFKYMNSAEFLLFEHSREVPVIVILNVHKHLLVLKIN